MECKKCAGMFYLKRNFIDLLLVQNVYLCSRCYRSHPIQLELLSQQLEDYHCTILSMFSRKYFIDYNFFVKEYNQIIHKYLFENQMFFLFFDHIDLSDEQLEVLNVISKLVEKDIFVLCFHVKK